MHDEEPSLRDIPGVGPTTLKKLISGGYPSVTHIAMSSPKELAERCGIGLGVAANIVRAARRMVRGGVKPASTVLSELEKLPRLTTGVKNLDAILNGGIPVTKILEVAGKFATGKSNFCHQLAITVQLPRAQGGLEGGAFYLDTEGTFSPQKMIKIAKRFGLDPKAALDNIFYGSARSVDEQTDVLEEAVEIINTRGLRLLVIDSVTALFRVEYIGRGELASRQQSLNVYLHRIKKIVEAYKMVGVLTNQVLSMPDVMFVDPTAPVGGNIMAHFSTYRLMFKKSANTLKATIIDAPDLPPAEAEFMITEDGLTDVNRE